MENFRQMLGPLTIYDMVILGILAVLIGRGIWVGALRQVTALLALYLGYFVASRYHEEIFPMLGNLSDNPKVVFLAAYVILFVVTYIVVMLLGKVLSYVVSLTLTGWFDRLLGGVIGLLKGAIIAVLIHIVVGTVISPENDMLRTCVCCEVLGETADLTRSVIRNSDVRKSLQQKAPAIDIGQMKSMLKKAAEKDAAATRKSADSPKKPAEKTVASPKKPAATPAVPEKKPAKEPQPPPKQPDSAESASE